MPDCLFPQPFREARRARRARRKEVAEQRMASGERGVELGTLGEEMVVVASDEEAGGSRQGQRDEQVQEQDVGERRCIREIEREGEDGGDEETTAFPPFDPGLDIDYTGDAYVYSTAPGQIVDLDRQSSLVVESQVENESDDDEDDSENDSAGSQSASDSDNISRRLDQYHAELRELQAMVAAGTVVQVRRGVRELAGRDDFNFDGTEPGARRSVDSTRSEHEQGGDACTEPIGTNNIPRLTSPLPPTPRSQFAQPGPEQPPAYSGHELRSPLYAETDPNP